MIPQKLSTFLTGAVLFPLAMTASNDVYPPKLNVPVYNDYSQKSNIPTLYIDTENNAQIQSKNGDYVRAILHYVDENGTTVYDSLGIRGRGNSTWGLAKKPYRIKFDKKQEFLGKERAKAKSWTLLANHADKTLMRNAVAACIGTFCGQPFTAAAQFVDLVLNGTYLGNYQISDQMEIRKKRVDITEQDEPATEESNITGGYFLEVDGFAYSEKVYIKSRKGVAITVKSPDEDIINNAQINYIRDYINEFEDALFSEDFTDPEKGYRKYVDESTLISWYIATELTGNVDGFWSTYIYKDKDDPKIYWGPLWDYDIAFNNCNRVGDVSGSLMTERGFGDDLTKLWVRRMWQDPWFANLVNNRWKELVDAGIEQHVLDYIDSIADLIDESQRLNFSKWRINERAYNEIMLFSTYREGVDYLKKFISQHVQYLGGAFEIAAEEATPPAPFEADTNYYYSILNKGSQTCLSVNTGGTQIFMWQPLENDHSQHWQFVPSDEEGYYYILNRETNKAVADASPANGASFSTGTQLALEEHDLTNPRQLWEITPASKTGTGYIIANRLTNLAWNNSGGSSSNGNAVISWNNDSQNPLKATRQWLLTKEESMPTGLRELNEVERDYFVSYDRAEGMIRFVVCGDGELEGNGSVIGLDGSVISTFRLFEGADVSSLRSGVYVLTWTCDGRMRSLKFTR